MMIENRAGDDDGGSFVHVLRLPQHGLPHLAPLLDTVMWKRLGMFGLLSRGILTGSTVQFGDALFLLVVADDDPTPALEVATRGCLVRGIDQPKE
jgi:hypothetical protein